MTDQDKPKDRDWDKEMREVDRLLAKLPAPDPGLGAGSDPTLRRPVAAIPGAPPAATTASGAQWLGTWARVTLGLLIGVGMTQWPYTHGCSIRLFFYLIGVGAVITAGVWSSLSSWKRRLGVAHVLSQLLIVWGLLLAAREVLPRVGYARTQAQWLCPGGPPK